MEKSTNANNYEQQKIRGLKRKIDAINQKGGKCEYCGYNQNISALDFHHLDPSTKSFQLDSRHFSNTNLESLQEELDKCILLCANCHREEHNPDYNIDKIHNILQNSSKRSFSSTEDIKKGSVCPTCGNRFKKVSGKIYCCKECRPKNDIVKNYPSIEEINEQYIILKSYEKVAQYFGLTRKIIQGIQKRHS